MAEYVSKYTGAEIDAAIAKANSALQPEDLDSVNGGGESNLFVCDVDIITTDDGEYKDTWNTETTISESVRQSYLQIKQAIDNSNDIKVHITISDSEQTETDEYNVFPVVEKYSNGACLICTIDDYYVEVYINNHYQEVDINFRYNPILKIHNKMGEMEHEDESSQVCFSVGEQGSINGNLVTALYNEDDKDYYKRSTPLSCVMNVFDNDTRSNVVLPASLSVPNNIPYYGSYLDLESSMYDVRITGQYGSKTYSLRAKKKLSFIPNIYDEYGYGTNINMLPVTAIYDSVNGEWSFDKTFNEIFNDDVKNHGILLIVRNMNYCDYERGYEVRDIGEGSYDRFPIDYTVPLEFAEDKFVGTYRYSNYVEGYGDVEWLSTVAIEAGKEWVCEEKDLAAIPMMAIIVNLTTNLNGYQLQTFAASEQLTDAGGYPYYLITRNGENLTYEDAADYMEYMCGSRFVPQYNLQKPQNAVFIDPQMHLFKPQFDANSDGLRIYVLGSAQQ